MSDTSRKIMIESGKQHGWNRCPKLTSDDLQAIEEMKTLKGSVTLNKKEDIYEIRRIAIACKYIERTIKGIKDLNIMNINFPLTGLHICDHHFIIFCIC